jgi:hypothetical protein
MQIAEDSGPDKYFITKILIFGSLAGSLTQHMAAVVVIR